MPPPAIASTHRDSPQGRRLYSKLRALAVASVQPDVPKGRSRHTDRRMMTRSTSAVAALTPISTLITLARLLFLSSGVPHLVRGKLTPIFGPEKRISRKSRKKLGGCRKDLFRSRLAEADGAKNSPRRRNSAKKVDEPAHNPLTMPLVPSSIGVDRADVRSTEHVDKPNAGKTRELGTFALRDDATVVPKDCGGEPEPARTARPNPRTEVLRWSETHIDPLFVSPCRSRASGKRQAMATELSVTKPFLWAFGDSLLLAQDRSSSVISLIPRGDSAPCLRTCALL